MNQRGMVRIRPDALVSTRKAKMRADGKPWTQVDLAAAAECSFSLIAFLELGQRQPSLAVAARLAAALGVDVTDIADVAEGAAA